MVTKKTKEFIINKVYDQICINSEGNIEISGLKSWDAIKIDKDAEMANMRSKRVDDCVLIDVGFNSVILRGNVLSVLLNPEEYPMETIDILLR